MTTTKPKPDALIGIHRFIKKVYSEVWEDVVNEQRPYIELIMQQDGHSDPLRAVVPYVSDMEKRNQDPSLIIAVAYELKKRRAAEISKKRNGWTL